MINLLLSLAAGLAVELLFHVIGFRWYAGIFPALLAFAAAFVVLARRTAGKVQALGEQAQGVLGTVRTEKERTAALDKAIKIIESGFALARWQFFIAPELHANIGMLLYLKRDFDGAKPHLDKAFSRNWMAKVMLGCIHYMAKAAEPMKAAFEDAVSGGTSKKEAMPWAVYTWCLWKLDQPDAAMAVINRAVTENPSEEKLKKQQLALQNGKKLKMNAFEPMWWQFQLEKPPVEMTQPRVRFQRGRR